MKNEYLPDHSYRIPKEGEYIISFSGGRSSAYMLYRIHSANYGIPNNAKVLFANTGKEDPRTLDFVQAVSDNMGIDIIWLEYWYDEQAKGYSDPKNKVRVVDYETAARNGEPFESLIRNRNYYLPNVTQRFCTMELKVQSIDRYMRRVHGIKDYYKFLGIRYDEPNRWAKALLTEDCKSLFPMVTNKITKQDVLNHWKYQPYDLKTPDLLGNCDMCFLKGRRKLQETIRQYPENVKWWIEQENKCLEFRKDNLFEQSNARFFNGETYTQLKERTSREQRLWGGGNGCAN